MKQLRTDYAGSEWFGALKDQSPSDLKVIVDGTVGVNGRTVPHTEWCSLENGDKIECGRWIFHFEQEA